MAKTLQDDLRIARPALAVQLADALREMILEGMLPEGEKIREKEMTERFGVSRTPLREGMKMLAAEGLIDLIPNRGAIVSRQSHAELADTFPVLAALERLVGELAAQKASPAEITGITRMTRELGEMVRKGDRTGYFALNQEIHKTLLAAARNDALAHTHATIASRVHRARYQANLTHTRWHSALKEHEAISVALAARDAGLLGRLLHDHMMAKLASIMLMAQSDAAEQRSEIQS